MPNTINGTANAELLVGTEMADEIFGYGGNDTLQGGARADTLKGGAGDDSMEGGNGNDVYYVQQAGDVVVETNANSATGGIDLVLSFLSAYTLGANVENIRLMDAGVADATGNALDNLIFAGAGDNRLAGAGGIDTVSYRFAGGGVTVSLATQAVQATGGSGNDRLSGIENLEGSDFADVLKGNAKANVLDGRMGDDTMRGGDGDDTYFVDSAGDRVVESGWNSYTGGVDLVNTTVSFTLGDNLENLRILSDAAIDARGNALDNTIHAGDGDNNLWGGLGEDTVSYAFAGAGVKVSLGKTVAQATGGSGTDTLRGFENLEGSRFKDVLRGNSDSNVIDGGLGADTMAGGGGNDTYYVDNAGDRIVETANGWDQVYVSISEYTMPDGVEYAYANGAGTISITGNASGNTIFASDGNNDLDGGGGINTVSYYRSSAAVTVSLAEEAPQDTGGSGTDRLQNFRDIDSSYFNDHLIGNAEGNVFGSIYGQDTLEGGLGDDTYYINSGATVIENDNEGYDSIGVVGPSFTLPDNIEKAWVHSANSQELTGNGLDNSLWGLTGNDTLAGAGGNDTLTGAEGNDLLTGGGGADQFNFITALNASTNVDGITDFAPGVDHIGLENGIFTQLSAGALPAGSFVDGTAAADADDHLVYDGSTGSLYYDPDGNGAAEQVLFAVLEGNPALTPGDFVVF